ncbi:MAG: BatD family protein [Planctomycetota bacterium]
MRFRLVCWIALVAAAAPAQETLRVQGPEPATVVLGSNARVDLVVEGRSADPRPPRVPAVDGLDCRVVGPQRQVYTSLTRSGMVEQVTARYQLILTPQREGTFTIPAFAMHTGSREQTVPALQLTAVKELRGAEFGYLDVRVEPRRVYVHEPVRVRVEFGVDKGLRAVQDVASNRTRYVDFEVQAGWLSDMQGTEPLEQPDPTGESVPVVLNRALQRAEYDSAHERGGKVYNSFVFHKAFLPTRPGTLQLDAPLLRYHVQLTQGRVGLFGERVGAQTENYYVYGEPIALEVLPIPEAGRPTPYFGAVGRFALDATLNTDTVKVGGSVKLVLRISGSGNFEFLRVPDLSTLEPMGLHLLGQTEERKSDAVTVTYDLTPLRADVTEVPPVAWNYFDTTPGVEAFAEVATRPLPLHVQPLADGEELLALPEAATKAVTPGVDDIFDLPDLSGAPVPRPRPWPLGAWLAALAPWALVLGFGVVRLLRRRAAADPGRARSRGAARRCLRALDAGAAPLEALCGYLADRLDLPAAAVIGPDLAQRLQQAGLDPGRAVGAQRAVEQGTAARYGGGGGLDPAQVRSLVQELEGVPLRRLGAGPAALLLLVLAGALAAPAPAQADAGYAAYRDGDYATAAAAFERATERQDDRRLWFARGNCYYRLGDLPRAVWAWECARLGLPRDPELAANLRLARRRLELDAEGEGFARALGQLARWFTAPELVWLCGLCMTIAALGLGVFRRHAVPRWIGAIALVPGVLLALELLWLRPARPQHAIAARPLELVAEPRAGLEPVARVAPGVELTLRSQVTGEWVRVDAGERSGYAPGDAVLPIR